ncbi:MAG: 50S ribosomal protein L23 [Elusimicrobiota bacterium]|nr:50S ribosomal protein L23 [Elusimicrobiota bacterium]
MNIRNVIKKSVETEKAAIIREKYNEYSFVVDKTANKYLIKQAIETLFNVKVESVHTANYAGKSKRQGASSGYKSDWKKAIVKLAKGQEIKSIEEI